MPPTTSQAPGDLLSLKAAAESLGVSQRTVMRYETNGLISAYRSPVTKRLGFAPADVEKLRAQMPSITDTPLADSGSVTS
ncbi:MAG TPA: MerR family transcriptional regulator [Kineosporiaceae bacterium]|nr:MerR family transcriptional regulator [Kineosporiaceae bacterium]